jgi:hypothetical protein
MAAGPVGPATPGALDLRVVADDTDIPLRLVSAIRQSNVKPQSSAIQEMSRRSFIQKGYDPDSAFEIRRNYNYTDEPGKVGGVLSFTTNPEIFSGERSIPFMAQVQDLLTDADIGAGKYSEAEVQFLREALQRMGKARP